MSESGTKDSKLLKRLHFEMLLFDLSRAFVNISVDEIDSTLESALQRIAEFLRFDRVTFIQKLKNDQLKASHSWSVNNVPKVTPYFVNERFPQLVEYFEKTRTPMVLSLEEEIPDEISRDAELLKQGGTKSVVIVPLIVGGSSLGGLTAGSFLEKRDISERLLHRLRLLAEIFANAMSRKESHDSLMQAFQEISELKEQLEAECTYLREEIKLDHDFSRVVGQSPAIQQVLQQVERVAPMNTTVMVQGETGTGKELIARSIHDISPRRNRPLIKVDCASLPANLIENELFGHEKGAYTDAREKKIGRLELANGGTVFLDEIGELPLQVQSRLLRVLQENAFERVGGSQVIHVDIRIIAATNRDLEDEVRKGNFREDLWYRLNVFPLSVPPLRKRKEDIPLLVNWFVQQCNKKVGKQIDKIPNTTLQVLQNHRWPGNIRELENVIERMVINSQGKTLQTHEFTERAGGSEHTQFQLGTLADFERQHILQTLIHTGWKIQGPGGAAEILGIKPSTLRDRMKKREIKRPTIPWPT